MKKFVTAFTATALVALSACAQDDADATDGEVMTAEEGTTDATTVDTMDPTTTGTADMQDMDDGDRVAIDENGVTADINDGDASVNANVSDNPSLEVETD
ncbi:MAG: hypothetical protein WBA68_01670 [Alteraurantiacibacter sp.]